MKTVKGDLLKLAHEGEFDLIVQGCNCFHMMGAGIALQIAEQYPEALQADKEFMKRGDRKMLGKFSVADADGVDDHIFSIVNAYTQYHGGSNYDYNAIDKVFKSLESGMRPYKKTIRIGIPMIGAGIAGGNWDVIKVIIDSHLKGYDLTLVEYAP